MKLLYAALLAFVLLPLVHAEAAPQKILVFDFYFDNTSPEPTSAAETARIKRISDDLRAELQKSGDYDVITSSETFDSIQQGKCSSEEMAVAQKQGAELVACSWLQKVSNLILNLNMVIENAKTGELLKGGSVDIRGNTDLSWDHGVRYLLKEHVFQKS
jgi:hypothetical protein